LAYSAKGQSAEAQALGGLTYRHGALPDRDDVLVGLARFMDNATAGLTSTDALPIVLETTRTSALCASLL
jgi:hypothetical protein